MFNVFFRAFPLFPLLERHEEESIVGTGDGAKQAVTGNSGHLLYAGNFQQNLLHFLGGIVRALQRGGVGKREICVKIPLILVRQKPGGDSLAQPSGSNKDQNEKKHGHKASTDQQMA